MEDLRNQEILEKVNLFLSADGEGGQTRLAMAIGYSNSSAINQYIKGTYKSPQAIETKLKEFFATKKQAEQLNDTPGYVPTSISTAVYQTIRNCHLQGGLAIECGDAGIGKTKAAEQYIKDYPNSAVLITINPCFSSVSSFLKLLCRTLHINEGRKDDMWLNCAGRFVGRKILIVDEAQHLPIKTIELIRAMSDFVPDMGVTFIGNRSSVDNMSGCREAVYAQITSRMKQKKIRFTNNIKANDIELLFPALKHKEMQKEVRFLLTIAQSKQGIRGDRKSVV